MVKRIHIVNAAATRRSWQKRWCIHFLYLKWKWKHVCRHKLTSLSLINRLNRWRRRSNGWSFSFSWEMHKCQVSWFSQLLFWFSWAKTSISSVLCHPRASIPHRRCCKSTLYLLSSNQGPLISSCLAFSRATALGLGCSGSSLTALMLQSMQMSGSRRPLLTMLSVTIQPCP